MLSSLPPQAHGDAFFETVAVRGLASTAIERGDFASAHALLLETVTLSRRVQNATVDYPTVLGYFARLAAAEDQPERALRLAGAAAALRQAAGTHPFRHDHELLEWRLDQVQRVLSAEAAAAASVEGQAMALEDALAYAVAPGARPVLKS